jgi:predicted nucleic acid-binding protein
MRIVFVDTSAWVALTRKKDIHHASAVKFWREITRSDSLLITSEFVLAETYTLMMSRKMNLNQVSAFKGLLENCMKEGILRVERASESTFAKAWNVFAKHMDQGLSYVDCISYLVSRDKKADCIFAFDDHFRILGLDTLPYRSKG